MKMEFSLSAVSIWELGKRKKQEDSIYPKCGEWQDSDRLFILCDGMGGHSGGDIASNTVCSAMSKYITDNYENDAYFTSEDFDKALDHAYDALDEMDNGASKKMGTTLTFLKFHRSGCTIAHIGDSRVYHIRPGITPENTKILFQTIDHSLINDLIKLGELTEEQAKVSNQRNIITRAMQPNGEKRYSADVYHTQDLCEGDYFLLCSDGILEHMEDENLKYIFSDSGGDISNKIEIIKRATADNNDNHSAILVRVNKVVKESPFVEHDDDGNVYIEESTESDFGRKIIRGCLAIIAILCLIYLLHYFYVTYRQEEKTIEPIENVQDGNQIQKNDSQLAKPTKTQAVLEKIQNQSSKPNPTRSSSNKQGLTKQQGPKKSQSEQSDVKHPESPNRIEDGEQTNSQVDKISECNQTQSETAVVYMDDSESQSGKISAQNSKESVHYDNNEVYSNDAVSDDDTEVLNSNEQNLTNRKSSRKSKH